VDVEKRKLYHITFWDHSSGGDYPIKCFLVGYLIKEHDDSYVLSPWITTDEEYFENNLEKYCILKGVTTNVYEISLS